MPILGKEPDIYPPDLLTNPSVLADLSKQDTATESTAGSMPIGYCIYTLSRREKDLMRKLHSQQIRFYGPIITKRFRSPGGRMRTSYVPLFPNYIFMFGDESDRYQAMTTNCISQCTPVQDTDQLISDLRQISAVIGEGVAMTPEARLDAGSPARVKSGPFAGYEGTVVRREGKTRLLLSVKFLEQGISIALDEALIEPM
jgi:transcription antitermination factor NusG